MYPDYAAGRDAHGTQVSFDEAVTFLCQGAGAGARQ